jgi:ubiquinone/menaquinone biosynthesis C-methylase UbiE
MGAPCVLASLGASDPEARKRHLNGHRHDRSSAAAFGKVAETYERRRPSYPSEAVDWIAERLGLGPGTTVVDVAAGTGKLTRQLVPTGARVVAVEPLAEMREQLRSAVPGVEVLDGSAEALPLPDAGADAITVAAAFHWFEVDRALPELHRVLRPGGGLAIVGNGRDLTQPLQAAVQEIVGPYLPDLTKLDEEWLPVLEASRLFGPLERFETSFEQLFDAKGLAERMATVSYVARLPDAMRAEVLTRVRALGEAQPETPFPFRYRTYALVCYTS